MIAVLLGGFRILREPVKTCRYRNYFGSFPQSSKARTLR